MLLPRKSRAQFGALLRALAAAAAAREPGLRAAHVALDDTGLEDVFFTIDAPTAPPRAARRRRRRGRRRAGRRDQGGRARRRAAVARRADARAGGRARAQAARRGAARLRRSSSSAAAAAPRPRRVATPGAPRRSPGAASFGEPKKMREAEANVVAAAIVIWAGWLLVPGLLPRRSSPSAKTAAAALLVNGGCSDLAHALGTAAATRACSRPSRSSARRSSRSPRATPPAATPRSRPRGGTAARSRAASRSSASSRAGTRSCSRAPLAGSRRCYVLAPLVSLFLNALPSTAMGALSVRVRLRRRRPSPP